MIARIKQSHHRVADELHQMNSMAYVTPSIFLAVSTFLFNIVLSRMVHQQKEQIATLASVWLQAVGNRLSLRQVRAVAGGDWLGRRLPCRDSSVVVDDRHVRAILSISRRPLRIRRARSDPGNFIRTCRSDGRQFFCDSPRHAVAARRGDASRSADRSASVRLPTSSGSAIFSRRSTRMIIRRLEDNRRTTIFSVLGMAMGLAVVVLGSFFEDTIDYVTEVQFERSQRQDVMLTFYEPVSPDALHDVEHLPGVTRAEPFRAVPVRLRHGTREHRLSLMGLEHQPHLYRVLDDSERPISLPPVSGLTISKKLAEILDVTTGDELTVEVLEGQRDRHRVQVAADFSRLHESGRLSESQRAAPIDDRRRAVLGSISGCRSAAFG